MATRSAAAVEQSHGFDLKTSPPIFILPTHLQTEELRKAEDLVYQLGGKLTYDAGEARLFLGKVGQKKRAAFDLRARDVWTEDAVLPTWKAGSDAPGSSDEPARKRRKVSADVATERTLSSTASEAESDLSDDADVANKAGNYWPDLTDFIIVLKLAWLEACVKKGKLVPFKPYTVYTAKIIPKPASETSPKALPSEGITYIKATPEHSSPSASTSTSPVRTKAGTATSSILERARLEAEASGQKQASSAYPTRRRFGDRSHPYKKSSSPVSPRSQRPKLHRTTTSELEELAEHPIPPLPDWATGPHASYACCRSTPMNTHNAAFIAQLIKIRDARLLTLDEIGVRAYSTSIASVSAYPHRINRLEELTRLPGCHDKIALLWSEWHHSADEDSERHIQTVQHLEADEDLKVLGLFWNIWGVGPDTARKFYFEHGWKDLDDVVEFGWNALTRVQQIGVKFYDEFLVKIPRKEVEEINEVIVRHARLVLDMQEEDHGTARDVECVIVGGYRRGKEHCGDVDVILSHRDESKTKDLVVDVVRSLETEGWVTHTLSLHTTTSDRGQATLPFRAQGHSGHGFDSLDKALCVWQDPRFEADSSSSGASATQKNPNIHRRVDIIVSTWRTVGCAVLGWSGGTTFQRDIRRFVNKVHSWKFDSSGVRDRASGRVLDFEAPREVKSEDGAMALDDADTWMDRERRLMEGLGIGFRPATERCTG
jgi:DNA polymerase IV